LSHTCRGGVRKKPRYKPTVLDYRGKTPSACACASFTVSATTCTVGQNVIFVQGAPTMPLNTPKLNEGASSDFALSCSTSCGHNLHGVCSNLSSCQLTQTCPITPMWHKCLFLSNPFHVNNQYPYLPTPHYSQRGSQPQGHDPVQIQTLHPRQQNQRQIRQNSSHMQRYASASRCTPGHTIILNTVTLHIL
jgi:hypothetical protein